MYFVSYFMILLTIIIICLNLKISILSELENAIISTKSKLMLSLNFLSLGGLPPFIGFLLKFLIINIIIQSISIKIIILILIIISLISLFYYLKVTYVFLFKNVYLTKITTLKTTNNNIFFTTLTLIRNLILPGILILL